MKDFSLVSKRQLTRNTADFGSHFICTKGKSPLPYGIWLNIPKLREKDDTELAKMLVELIEWVKA